MAVFVRPFKVEDLSAFEPIEEGLLREDTELAKSIEESGLAITGIRDGIVWGCGGVHPDGEHGEIWIRLSKDCLKHKLDTIRWLREGMKVIEETFGFRQINATIKCGFAQSIKLVKYLGFVKTGTRTHEGQKWNIYSKLVKA